jgi:N-acetylglucosaminyldiphosphoundecaprenol N-acetyl-beta-D-mannosaminyltransferase
MIEFTRYDLLGVPVTPMSVEQVVQVTADFIHERRRSIIAYHNLHSVYLAHRDARMRRFYERARVVIIDGMPLIGIGRLLGYPLARSDRVAALDWLPTMMERAARDGWRIFLLGGRPGVAERARALLQQRYPGAGFDAHHGFFEWGGGKPEGDQVLARINEFDPDLLMVGMGMPRQEAWLLDHEPRLEARVLTNIGALMDYLVGDIPSPPRWMGRVGLEWTYRLVTTPRRVAWRYLVEPWLVLPLLGRALTDRIRRSIAPSA